MKDVLTPDEYEPDYTLTKEEQEKKFEEWQKKTKEKLKELKKE